MSAKSEWTRAKIEVSCGGCGVRVYVGQPMLAIKFEHVKRTLVRCAECVGPAPPDFPELIARVESPQIQPTPIARTAKSFTRGKLSEPDWTARILGEREDQP